jgi:hypothetical protein
LLKAVVRCSGEGRDGLYLAVGHIKDSDFSKVDVLSVTILVWITTDRGRSTTGIAKLLEPKRHTSSIR